MYVSRQSNYYCKWLWSGLPHLILKFCCRFLPICRLRLYIFWSNFFSWWFALNIQIFSNVYKTVMFTIFSFFLFGCKKKSQIHKNALLSIYCSKFFTEIFLDSCLWFPKVQLVKIKRSLFNKIIHMFMSGHIQLSDNTNVIDVKASKRCWEKGRVLFTRKQNTIKHLDWTDVQLIHLGYAVLIQGIHSKALKQLFSMFNLFIPMTWWCPFFG